MKVIDLLGMLTDYQRVSIYPVADLDWDASNPYVLDPERVQDLKWYFIRSVGQRTVETIGTDSNDNEYLYNKSFLKIEYR